MAVWYEEQMVKDMMGVMGGKAIRGLVTTFASSNIYIGKSGLLTVAKLIEAIIPEEERRALIFTDAFTKKFSKIVIDYCDLCKIEYQIFSEVEPEVPLKNVEDGVKICEEFKPKVLIAIGGGSVMDAAKATMIKYEIPDVNFNVLLPIGDPLGLRRKLRFLVAIPTTSGTGSEVTNAAVLTDTTRTPPKKLEITNAEIVPDMAILDTDFVEDMPPSLTRGSGLDALAHAIGSYVSNWGNPIVDPLNISAIKEILKYLPRAYKYGKKDLEARSHMQVAATLAGLGFTNTVPGVDHALGHSFGKIFRVHHGLAVGIFLPYVIGFQAKVTDRWKDLCPVFNVNPNGKGKDILLKEFLDALKAFMSSIGTPTAIKDLTEPKISKEDYLNNLDVLANYAENDGASLFSYRALSNELCRKIFEYAWDEKDIDF
ncbi:MAG: iron-containing alcohol dehydrogenase [Candidatus Thorarchaeota archaeon]